LGDITHVLPTLRTLQNHWPNTEIIWVIGKSEYPLVKSVKDVQFIVFDKSAGLATASQRLRLRYPAAHAVIDPCLHDQFIDPGDDQAGF